MVDNVRKSFWVKDWKWCCEACGTLTNDGECDCTKFPETVHMQRLVRTIGIDTDDDKGG